MESVNVLVTTAIGDENVRRITAVSPGIKLTDVSSLSRAEYGVKWIQVMSAGVNRFLDSEMVASPVVITNVSGIHAVQISEFVLGLMLMFVKQSPLCFQLKQEKQWKRFTLSVLRSKTVGIVGLGHIGREVARLAKAFGMRVLATRRSVKRVGRARYVDIMLPQDQLRRLLRESDFVVLTLPLTPETDKFFGEEELRSMKSSSYLINIARGGLVDEEVLIRALDEHWIAGAGLDVFTTEPLPAGSRLWELPNVLLSPHISGSLEDNLERTTDIFLENLRRYLNGEKLFNVVDKKKGY
ncbi:MAG: D-2-hydroxyacid dehydrogenase [Chloroflexi bacterium]|nr:D-2-hydroxyacid dehydrogenase [Chloroflexota bacterium]